MQLALGSTNRSVPVKPTFVVTGVRLHVATDQVRPDLTYLVLLRSFLRHAPDAFRTPLRSGLVRQFADPPEDRRR